MSVYSPTITVMIKAVRRATKALIRDFGELENLQVSRKGTNDFVSAADLKAEKILVEELQKARPKFGFLTEENGVIKGEDETHRWIVDPLDGTINFLHGNPTFCTTIALEKTHYNGSKEIIAAITASPILSEIYWAEKGMGAWVEDERGSSRRLRVSARTRFSDSLFCLGSLKTDTDIANKIASQSSGVRVIGSTALALAYTAAGTFDGFMQSKTNYWDIAAGILLIKEAGGVISNYNDKFNFTNGSSAIAANDMMHKTLLQEAVK
jgi:myo-inositol-1(or 4)-monophosphatase